MARSSLGTDVTVSACWYKEPASADSHLLWEQQYLYMAASIFAARLDSHRKRSALQPAAEERRSLRRVGTPELNPDSWPRG